MEKTKPNQVKLTPEEFKELFGKNTKTAPPSIYDGLPEFMQSCLDSRRKPNHTWS